MVTRAFLIVLGAVLALSSPGICGAAELKIATVAPEGSKWMQEMRAGAAQIKERTGGRVTLRFFGGGVMGDDRSVLRKIRIRQLQGAAFTAGGLAAVYPDINLYSLPLLFRSPEELDYVRARMDQVLLDGLEKAGFVSFGLAGGGSALLMAKLPVRRLEDLKGQKIWVPEGDRISYVAMEALGLAPVPLPMTDVLTGLQTGLIDIVANSPVGAIAFQWHTKVRYVTRVPLGYLFATLVIDRPAFDALRPEDQAVVREVMGRIYARFDARSRRDNEMAAEALARQGLIFIDPPQEEVDRLHEKIRDVIRRLGEEGAYTPALFARLQGYLDDYRNRREGAR